MYVETFQHLILLTTQPTFFFLIIVPPWASDGMQGEKEERALNESQDHDLEM